MTDSGDDDLELDLDDILMNHTRNAHVITTANDRLQEEANVDVIDMTQKALQYTIPRKQIDEIQEYFPYLFVT